GSVRTITERLGARVTLFAYPSGRFSPSVLPALREAGIEAAVTTEGGWNGPGQDLYRLKRMDAGFASTRTRFSRSLFDAEVQGVFNPIRKLAEGLISQRIDACFCGSKSFRVAIPALLEARRLAWVISGGPSSSSPTASAAPWRPRARRWSA